MSDCSACGGPLARSSPHFPELAIRRCDGCGLVYADQERWRVDPPKLYGSDYFHGEEYADYVRDRAIAELNFKRVIRRMRSWSRGGRLFEIGCAYGFFLRQCAGWDAEGIDVSADAVAYAKGLGVRARVGDFLEAPIEPPYDAFCMWDTIEHLAEPARYVEKIAKSLRPGGHLFLTTGDIGSAMARWRGPRWRLVHPPTHLFYFSRATITRMLARLGLKVVHISSQGYYRSLDSMFYQLSLQRRGTLRRALTALSGLSLARVPLYSNLGDIMFVTAHRDP